MFRRLRNILHKPSPAPVQPPRPKQTKKPSDWSPQHPTLQLDTGLHPALKEAITTNSPATCIEEIAPFLYRFPLFDAATHRAFTHEIRAWLDWIALHQVSTQPPNSMNEYGIILSETPWAAQLSRIKDEVVSPLAALLFPKIAGEGLDGLHSFIVDYGFYRDTDLGFHLDNIEVTLNLCLGDQFSGSELYFQGRRCPAHRQTPHRPEEHIVVPHQPGFAILHAGAHRHGAYPIRSGSRQNLIMWCSSSSYRQQEESCDDWCGAHGEPL